MTELNYSFFINQNDNDNLKHMFSSIGNWIPLQYPRELNTLIINYQGFNRIEIFEFLELVLNSCVYNPRNLHQSYVNKKTDCDHSSLKKA